MSQTLAGPLEIFYTPKACLQYNQTMEICAHCLSEEKNLNFKPKFPNYFLSHNGPKQSNVV